MTVTKEIIKREELLYKTALALSLITIFYNIAEGIISVWFGADDKTLALFGFGIDSFVEVISGTGILHMIWRMKRENITSRDNFEVLALRITGIAFYILVAGLLTGATLAIINRAEPHTTMAGIIISSISILTMYFLFSAKLNTGKKLNNQSIISDAYCTKTCFYLSFILLASSLAYEWWQIPYIDALGSLGIAWYAFKEGREAFNKAKMKKVACNDHCG